MAQSGFIKLYRKIRQNWKWPKKEPYSRVEAWEDLIMEAAYKDTDRLIDEKLYHLKRGQLIASSRYLARRWHWGRAKVRSFIEKLLETKEIAQKTTQGITQITVLKYDTYNPPQPTKQPSDNPATTQRQPKSKKLKKLKKKIVEDSDEFQLASLLLQKIRERKPDYKEPNLQSWSKDIDLMLRIDKRKPEVIEKVILWCQGDDFWQNNILSVAKLRKQFDRLEMEMAKPKKEGTGQTPEVSTQNVPVSSRKTDISSAESAERAKRLIRGLAEKKGMPKEGK